MQTARALYIILVFLILTLPSMLLQALFLLINPHWSQRFPMWYHKQLSKILGLKLHVQGQVHYQDNPVLMVANHATWLDIAVLSQLAPVSFVAKEEVNSWPFFNLMARLQRTIFVNRARKSETHSVSNAIMKRLSQGQNIVFFPEGMGNDGNEVLPFKSSLFAAVKPTEKQKKIMAAENLMFNEHKVQVQTVSIAYTRLGGLPLGRQRRYKVAWVGEVALLPHIWFLLKAGTVDVYIKVGEPALLDSFKDRKELCAYTETQIKKTVSHLLVNEFKR